jgi:hypothetical protein
MLPRLVQLSLLQLWWARQSPKGAGQGSAVLLLPLQQLPQQQHAGQPCLAAVVRE